MMSSEEHRGKGNGNSKREKRHSQHMSPRKNRNPHPRGCHYCTAQKMKVMSWKQPPPRLITGGRDGELPDSWLLIGSNGGQKRIQPRNISGTERQKQDVISLEFYIHWRQSSNRSAKTKTNKKTDSARHKPPVLKEMLKDCLRTEGNSWRIKTEIHRGETDEY